MEEITISMSHKNELANVLEGKFVFIKKHWPANLFLLKVLVHFLKIVFYTL